MPYKDPEQRKKYMKNYCLTHPDKRQRWKEPKEKEYQKKI